MAETDIETDESAELIASNKVEGTTVYDAGGERLGTIYNFMIGKRSGQVEYAVLSFGGLFGLGSDYYPLPWQSLTYDENHGGYVLNIAKEDLQDAPRYNADEVSGYDRDSAREVDDYYILGRTPG